MNDRLANLHVKKGCQHADGTVALAYARSRHANPQLGDIARGGQQREVMAAVGHKALSPWTVLNPFRYWNLWTSTTENLIVDDDMSVLAMGRFGWAMTHSDLTCPVPISNLAVTWDPTRSKQMFKLIREDRNATPNIVLPPGNYVVHVAFGLVSAVRTVSLKAETDRESFVLPAGGLRIEGRVGTSRIPQNQISFAIYKGSQFDGSERTSLVPNVAAGDVALLPEGTYYIISNYGDANSVVRSDIRVQAGKLTDVIVTHRAAVITLKLVSDKGGEALANTAWSVITPGGDVIKESIGAFPRVVLSEGEYRAIAKNEGKVFERPFNVVNGVDGEVEVVAR
jgi:hypothetical protein